jgi:hydroxyacylglutathione hydrolase
MYFEQFYLGCMAHASYLIGSSGEAAVVDPQRDVDEYIAHAAARGLAIKYIIETHMHADFVSGHRELADRTGAQIVVGRKSRVGFPHLAVSEGDALRVGDVFLWVIETPGHTPDGICVLAADATNPHEPRRLLTGDTLFVGDVGRPDLSDSRGCSKEEMAGLLYESLHDKLMKLDDRVQVCPAHGAGSLCGRNLSSETMSTIGKQRKSNYALQRMSKGAFVKLATANLPEIPQYFPESVERNRIGASPLGSVPTPVPVDPRDFHAIRDAYLVLDVRSSSAFGRGHVPGSLNIGLDGRFASWAGSLIPLGTPVVIVADSTSDVTQTVTRLARVGHESVDAYLRGGVDAWEAAGLRVGRTRQISTYELWQRIDGNQRLELIDVRRPGEFATGHIAGATNVPLAELSQTVDLKDPGRSLVLTCQSGYRSSAAASILERMGFGTISNVCGGMTAWVKAGLPLSEPPAAAAA